MKCISFIGKTDYQLTDYQFENEPLHDPAIKKKYVQDYIVHAFLKDSAGCHIDQMYVFRTDHVECLRNYNALKQLLEKDVNIQDIVYDSADVNQFIEKMDALLQDGDEIIIDITYTYRDIPLSIMQILPYLQASKNIVIDHIYYAKWNKDESVTIIYDYIHFFEDSRIISYLEQFHNTIRVPEKDKVMTHNKEMEMLISKMREINVSINKSSMQKTMENIEEMRELCKKIKTTQQRFAMYLEQIIDDYAWMDEKNEYIRANELCRFMAEHGYYQYAITSLDQNSNVILSAVLLSESSKGAKNTHTISKDAHSLSIALEEAARYQKMEKLNDFPTISDPKKRQLLALYRNANLFYRDQNSFREYRNFIDHGESLDKRDPKEVIYLIKKYIALLNQIVQLPNIYHRTY